MQDVVLFTRQRGEGPQGTEQQMLSAQVRAIESYASHAHLRIVDRVVEIGTLGSVPGRTSTITPPPTTSWIMRLKTLLAILLVTRTSRTRSCCRGSRASSGVVRVK